MAGLVIGVDGGGTRTLAVAARADGTIVGRAAGRGVNYHNMGIDAARDNLWETVAALLRVCGATGYDRMVLGMSALDADADAETVRRFAGDRFDPATLRMHSDAYIALIGATLGEPGMIVICGTGSMILLLDGDGRQHVSLGWGALLGDAGSAHTLAIDGLRAAIARWEEMGPATALADAVLRVYGLTEPRALIDRLYAADASADKIAQFARAVLDTAKAGDPVALGIVQGNMQYLAQKCGLLLGRHPEALRVGISGGVFRHQAWVGDLFRGALRSLVPGARVEPPDYPPEVGAVLCDFLARGALNEQVLRRARESEGEAVYASV
ncbi:ATPase [Clostridia bacterium]|nr:ATPase [Clostridia bacterium]